MADTDDLLITTEDRAAALSVAMGVFPRPWQARRQRKLYAHVLSVITRTRIDTAVNPTTREKLDSHDLEVRARLAYLQATPSGLPWEFLTELVRDIWRQRIREGRRS